MMGLLSSGVFGWPAEECRGGVTAEDTLLCGLRRVLLCPGHHVLALPGSRVRRAPVVSILVQEAPGPGSPLGLWAPMKPPSLSSLAHPQGPKQAGADSGWGLLVVTLLTDPCLSRVPKSERATVHKNLTFSLASAEGFLMASEWAKANKVGTQQLCL